MERSPMIMDKKQLNVLRLRFLKSLMLYFSGIEKAILKFMWNHKMSWTDKTMQTRTTVLEVSPYMTSSYTTEP